MATPPIMYVCNMRPGALWLPVKKKATLADGLGAFGCPSLNLWCACLDSGARYRFITNHVTYLCLSNEARQLR